MDYLVDILGALALGFGVLSYGFRQDSVLRLLNLLCCVLWMGHFALMKDHSAVMMLVIAIVMIGSSALGFFRISRCAFWVNACLVPASLMSAYLGLSSWRAILPVMGGFFINGAVSFLQGHKMTFFIALGEIVWLVNGLLIGSAYASVSAVFGVLALGVRTFKILRKDGTGVESERLSAAPV